MKRYYRRTCNAFEGHKRYVRSENCKVIASQKVICFMIKLDETSRMAKQSARYFLIWQC